MCGQENKKMSVQDTIEILTQECIELRRLLKQTSNQIDKEKIALKHIRDYDKTDICINNFQKGLEWFNVNEELSMQKHLAGKVVVLDFFTYCCINCMHILPDLEALEKKFSVKDGLVVIGVHSAKFSNERDSAKILSAVQRYNISHPVVNDSKLSMWRDIGITCWPSLVILGPKGQPLFVLVGEGHRDELFLYIKVALAYYKNLEQISNHELPLNPAKHLLPMSRDVLLFPGKIQTFIQGVDEKIVVSDTGNNRILVLTIDGIVEEVIGGYSPGFKDGNFREARFNAPQGVCILEKDIFVADNENHAIRRINLEKKIVETVAGTGSQGHDYVGGKAGKEQELSSPWDVAVYKHESCGKMVNVLLIAMSGTHQIWALFLEDTLWWKKKECRAGKCAAIVGSGREENRNNSYPHAAGLAQPSGIAVAQDLKLLYFADSESSSIRKVSLFDGKVSAVAGGDKNPADLHNFGDVDGVQYSAKLQHPLGVAWDDSEGVLYVADTYNHKIKKLETSGMCSTYCGAGKPTENHKFDEPSGLAILKKTNCLLIADTNNHSIKIIDKKNESIATITLKLPKGSGRPADKNFSFSIDISNEESNLNISFLLKLTSGLKFTPEAPQEWFLNNLPSTWSPVKLQGALDLPIVVKIPKGDNNETVGIKLKLLICKVDECIPKKIDVSFEIRRLPGAPTQVNECKELEIK